MAFLEGQDSVSPSKMTPGLDFYCYYAAGAFSDAATVAKLFPGKKYIGIAPSVVKGVDILDVETGDAVNSAIPQHLRLNAKAPNLVKPGFYTSAGNVAAANAECAAAGFERSNYLVFSAHWSGKKHLCSPTECGYPQADITQWASNNNFDSDYANANVFPSAPTDKHVDIQGWEVPRPNNGNIPAVIGWYGDEGTTWRQANIPQALWDQIKWSK